MILYFVVENEVNQNGKELGATYQMAFIET